MSSVAHCLTIDYPHQNMTRTDGRRQRNPSHKQNPLHRHHNSPISGTSAQPPAITTIRNPPSSVWNKVPSERETEREVQKPRHTRRDHKKHLPKTAKINRKNMTLLPQCLSRRILTTPLSSTPPPHCNTTIRTATRRTMIPISICSRFHHIPPPAHHLLVFNSSAKPTSECSPFSLCISGCRSISHATAAPPVNHGYDEEKETSVSSKLRILKQKVEGLEINCNSYEPGRYEVLLCPKPLIDLGLGRNPVIADASTSMIASHHRHQSSPTPVIADASHRCRPSSPTPFITIHRLCASLLTACKGGQSLDRGLSFHISENGDFATWKCSSVECGWAGQWCQVLAEDIASCNRVKVNCTGLMTVESLRLVPVGEKLISYFAERKISEDVLQRNAVMQISGNQNAIAFTYRCNEVLVTCKYRSLDKKFWQEKCKERIFYGLDDIKGADEIIIVSAVEGEIDKLSMEEAGFLNCVSVPDGAPAKVSAKLPSLEKDSGFQYLWNCKEHLDKASRIILATDGDPPGNALAEELARRLGRERCWRVRWPKKGEFSYYKDANEVLMNLGSAALRDVVHSAELYSMRN
ncbi:hypothetical protein RHGRI_036881 [Rhododendron griersonianum]|uniref:Toprim domain-containing protein n=1 Tax=Rhododendron griersonianum TaxID=479676 RepID=A0AAV6HQ81_9ERIC|nr:hypothetical protein RHGRI_036881 [Rhododendron griersonianum]